MLVQISPWQTTTTSTGAQKRRKRNKLDAPQLMDTMVSFVQGQRRSRQRRKQHPQLDDDDMVPQVVLTASHKASLVGHLRSQGTSWQESSVHQYATRPGPAFGYLASSCQIAAVMDGRKERLYALQNDNKKLVSWHASSIEGPETGSLFQLPSPAKCLHTRHGMVYGTCADGSTFLGQWVRNYVTKVESFHVQVFEGIVAANMVHAHTILQERDDYDAQVGEKRKATEMVNTYVLYQVFFSADQIIVVKANMKSEASSFQQVDHCVCKVKTNLDIDTSHVLATSLDESTLALVIRLNSNKADEVPHFFALRLCLESCRIGAPIKLPSTTRQAGGLSSSLLAIGTVDEVLVYDAIHGIRLKVEEMANVVSDTKDWRLVTDAKRNRMVVLSQQGEELFVSLATLENNEEEYSLATGLQSFSQVDDLQEFPIEINLLDTLEQSMITNSSHENITIVKALSALQVCVDHILDPLNKSVQPKFFMEAYECALAMVVPGSELPSTTRPEVTKSPAKNGQNGVHAGFHQKIVLLDDTRGYTPTSTPLEFVDGATTIILRVLQIPKVENEIVGIRVKLARLDARTILLRLIRTGKVSARTHFESPVRDADNAHNTPFLAFLRSMKLSQKKGIRVVSPVDVIHEMLSSCADITEHQLVTMIHYMLCRALPDDIAENFIEWKRFDSSHQYTQVSKAFFKERATVRKLERLNGASMNSPAMKGAQLQVASLSNKLLKMGSLFLVERVVKYSHCNETLLRTALQQGLPLADEPQLLSRLLLENFITSPSLASSKWMFALCEGCREQLMNFEGRSSYDAILTKIKDIIRNGEIILGLSQYLGDPSKKAQDNIDLARKTKVAKYARSKKGKNKDDQVPEYSLEHLIF